MDTLDELAATARRLTEAGALVGTSDHGTTKSLYGQDPDGLEFEVVWLVPADQLDDAALAARTRIGRLDLAADFQRYGGAPGAASASRSRCDPPSRRAGLTGCGRTTACRSTP